MSRNSIALMRDGSVMADWDLVDFLSGPTDLACVTDRQNRYRDFVTHPAATQATTDSAINFNGSADLHTPIHPPP